MGFHVSSRMGGTFENPTPEQLAGVLADLETEPWQPGYGWD